LYVVDAIDGVMLHAQMNGCDFRLLRILSALIAEFIGD
jgi:hypothetical protein